MRALLVLGSWLAALLLAVPATAAINADAISAYSQTTRQTFLEGLSSARRGTFSPDSAMAETLRGYPLYPYLIATQLRAELGSDSGPALDARIADFLADHPDMPPASRLESAWLDDLADRGRWTTIVDHTRADDSTTARCRYLAARIELGQADAAAARALYNVGSSQPSACDPVFAWLEQTGQLTRTLIRERAHKAILAGNTGLARYLARQVPDSQSAVIDSWVSVMQNPRTLDHAAPGLDDEIVAEAFEGYALSAPEAAAAAVPDLISRFDLGPAERHAMYRYIGLLFAQEHRPEALLWFARADHDRMAAEADDHALGWEIRAAIHQRRWPLVIDFINRLPPDIAEAEEWRYWQARALAATGQTDAARARYQKLAQQRSYHGYLAADALGVPYQFNARPVANDQNARSRLENRPAFQRVRELHALGMNGNAYREWRDLIADLPREEIMQAARIAYQWQWYARAITTLARADYWDDLDIRYPTPFAAAIRQASAANDLDPAFVYAIVRTESLFQPGVASPVGARGLMQIMPGTADHIARQMGRAAPSRAALSEPGLNTRFGAFYLADMMADWSGNIALATASYNAGPNKVAEWLPDQTMPADVWIATIPYTETRQYVQRVMSHMTVFQHRLSESIVRLAQRIDPVRPSYTDER